MISTNYIYKFKYVYIYFTETYSADILFWHRGWADAHKSVQYSEARVKAEIEFGPKTTLAALI